MVLQNALLVNQKNLRSKLANKSFTIRFVKRASGSYGTSCDPYNYGVCYNISTRDKSNLGDGHYIIFDVIENNKTSYTVEKMVILMM